jgi:hypothetical protein
VICSHDPVPRRLLTTLLGAALAAIVVLGSGIPAHAAKPHQQVPVCAPVSVRHSTKAAMAVFSGTVTAVERQPRTDGLPGALYLESVTVDLVYSGKINTETVQVETDRNRADCSLGSLAVDTEYMFFVTGTGAPWLASGDSGTRPSSETVAAQVVDLLGPGVNPIPPPPESAVFTPVDTSDPKTLSRAAAPGAALVLVGLLGLAVVRFVRTRTR